MTTYISLLRGINVSGQKKIKMPELKSLYESLGLRDVSTYIQSGNVIFNSDKEAALIKEQLQQNIAQCFSFDVSVEVISYDEFTKIKEQLPFTEVDIEQDGAKVLITFLSKVPKAMSIEKLMSYVKLPEQLIVKDKVIYLHCPNGYGKTKLSNNFIENKLKVIATTRNIKSIIKLSTLGLAIKGT